jgi:hypothetical protein
MKPIYRWMLSGLLFGSGALTGLAVASNPPAADPTTRVSFDNPRVTVREVTLAPGASRPTRTRETDELVLFYAESHYLAVTPQGKDGVKKERRDRAPGTVVWHKKGEVAPTLVNDGNKPVRYYSISVK